MSMTTLGATFMLPSGAMFDTKIGIQPGMHPVLRPIHKPLRQAYVLEIGAADWRTLLLGTALVGLVALGAYLLLSD